MNKDTPEDKEKQIKSSGENDTGPPQYYDSEPSAQPPGYAQGRPSTGLNIRSQYKNASPSGAYQYGESAARVHAVCATSSLSQPEEKSKKSWRERWKDFTTRRSREEKANREANSYQTLWKTDPDFRRHDARGDFSWSSRKWNVMGGDIGIRKSPHGAKKK
ncbi:hypothetical protein K491DRAFT_684466 [Lophiostoma macrostomum CBS 122681]|uniref:Uncharacterized protein n=1 Tax=Lophiostoma macrostomum CBS 122681 TaxID=1314788 RepID=A0A6A6SMK2_9PLEO|nr:hypothetical protein K491DRAFT_684466 [Lophiostoma macrostomum CBS 122681]